MKSIHKLLLFLFVAGMLFSCEKYEDYVTDFPYSSVYFASQKPVRTIVAYDQMTFKMGVALSGKRENTVDETAEFQIFPKLLDSTDIVGPNKFTLLPADYYTLSNTNTITIPSGRFIGDITVTLNKDKFTSDPLSTANTYAIPLKLIKTSADSILASKSHTILIVKYISPLHGFYYRKGAEKFKKNGNGADTTTVYNNPDLSRNVVWGLTTLDLNSVITSGVGTLTSTNGTLKLTKNADNTVVISKNGTLGTVTAVSGAGTYNPTKREFYLQYNYTNAAIQYAVTDTLILRRLPELELKYEEW